MITIQTSVYDTKDNSLKAKFRKFIETITHPLQTEKMKKFYEDMQALKKEAYLDYAHIDLHDRDDENQPKFDLEKDEFSIETSFITEEEKRWCSNRNVETLKIGDKTYPLHNENNVYHAYEVVDHTKQPYLKDRTFDCYEYFYKTVIHHNGQWFDISDYIKDELYFYKRKFHMTFTLDKEKAQQYEKLHKKYERIRKVGSFCYDVLHTIDSIILCLRFPFLYPRNRFSGLHYTNWSVNEYSKKLRDDSVLFAHVRVYNDEAHEEHPLLSFGSFPKVEKEIIEDNSRPYCKNKLYTRLFIKHNGKEYDLYSEKYSNTYYPVKVCGSLYIYSDKYQWRMIDEWKPKLKFDHSADEKYQYIDYHYDIVMNEVKYFFSKTVDWFHEWILGFIFCIPTYNELDAFPDGWRRKFGIQMCKDIRKALIADKCLFSYRITQIKEKFGQLRWYDAVSTKKVQEIISKYEEESERTCIVCGKPAKYRTTGWICPYCEEHIGDDKASAVELDENGRVVHKNEDIEEQ